MPSLFGIADDEARYVLDFWNVSSLGLLQARQIDEALQYRRRHTDTGLRVIANPQERARSLSVLDSRRPELQRDNEPRRVYTFRPEGAPPLSMSLGWELEANRGAVKNPRGVEVHSDGSVDGESKEYVVLPTLVNSPSYVLTLLKDLVHTAGLNTNPSCGFHVHMAPRKANLKTKRRWALMVEKLAKRVEDKAFSAVPPSRQSNNYCKRITLTTGGTFFEGAKYDNSRRYNWVNTVEMFRPGGIRTVEIRLLGNTHRWRYLLSWVAFCMELGLQAWRLVYQVEEFERAAAKLELILDGIAREVRPLEHRKADVPAWVWLYLAQHGIKQAKFDRPLKDLAELEARVHNPYGYVMPYSDLQPTQSDDDNLCSHGNDRENDCCYECDHEEGNCNGSPDCEYCRDARHADGEDCEYRRCTVCQSMREREAV